MTSVHDEGPSDDRRRGERRRRRQSGQSPVEILEQLPALVVLQRLPVPVLASDHNGAILFANSAFADMVGRPLTALQSLTFDQLLEAPAPAEGPSAATVMHAQAGRLVNLTHADGSTVRALMSQSALLREDDPIALTTFQDMTEQLWVNPRNHESMS
jgi:PAS domain-containing protein